MQVLARVLVMEAKVKIEANAASAPSWSQQDQDGVFRRTSLVLMAALRLACARYESNAYAVRVLAFTIRSSRGS